MGLVKNIGLRLDKSGPSDESEGPHLITGKLITANRFKSTSWKSEGAWDKHGRHTGDLRGSI